MRVMMPQLKNLQSKPLLKLSKVKVLLQLRKSIRMILSLKPKAVRLQVMKQAYLAILLTKPWVA
ncbi:Uncharacterised protein [Mycobacteroides abscessus subsp. abscessus]|nr:Uncharacterised protein [Mycobacteroides abscessus subsp. abscessus]